MEGKRSLSDSVLIKQLAKKNSCPPQVLNYSELPGQPAQFSVKRGLIYSLPLYEWV